MRKPIPKPKKLTKAEKIVAIARDVIAQLNKKKNPIKARKGTYFHTLSLYDIEDKDGDLQDYVDDIQQRGCEVCALGATLLSKARLFDNAPLGDFKTLGYDYIRAKDTTFLQPNKTSIVYTLSDIFGKQMLDLMEYAFESNIPPKPGLNIKKFYGAVVFGARFKTPRSRLIGIMKNIIDNNGKFVVAPANYEEYVAVVKPYTV